MQFHLTFTQPSTSKIFTVKELTFEQYRILNKFIGNKNNKHIDEYFNHIIESNSNATLLTNFDKFLLLFLLRLASISSEVEISSGKFTKKTSIIPIFTQLQSLSKSFKRTFTHDNFTLETDLPKNLCFNDVYDPLCFSIQEIIINGAPINYSSLSDEEKIAIFEKLPSSIISDLRAYQNEVSSVFKQCEIKLFDSDQSFIVSPFDNNMFEFIKVLFTTNLKSLYELQYILVSKLFYSAEYIDKNTLVENLILKNILETEMNQLKEERQKSVENKPQGYK